MGAVFLFLAIWVVLVAAKQESVTLQSEGQRIRVSSGFGSAKGGLLGLLVEVEVLELPVNNQYRPGYVSWRYSDESLRSLNDVQPLDNVWFHLVVYNERQHDISLYNNGPDLCILPSYYVG